MSTLMNTLVPVGTVDLVSRAPERVGQFSAAPSRHIIAHVDVAGADTVQQLLVVVLVHLW